MRSPKFGVWAVRASAILSCLLLACGGGGTGGERQPCYGNGTCNGGLVCLSKVCVKPTSAGGTQGTAGGSATGGAGRGGAGMAADGGSNAGRGGMGGGGSGGTGGVGSGGIGIGGTGSTGSGGTGGGGAGSGGMSGGGGAGTSGVGGTPTGLFALAGIYQHGTSRLGDGNGDGKSDLIYEGYPASPPDGGTTSATLAIWTGRGDGTFLAMAPTESKYDAAANPRLNFADANGDGRLDVLFPGAAAIGSAPSRLVLGNSINGDFGGADVATWTVPPPAGGWSDCGFGAFQVGALSRDWLLVGPDQTGMVKSSFSVVGAGGSASLPVFPIMGPTFGSVGTGGGAVCAGIADVDGDGNADIGLALTTATARSFMIAYGKGDRTFRSAMTTLPITASAGDSFSLIDADSDGKADVAVRSASGDGGLSCQLVWSEGNGAFAPAAATVPCPTAVGDFDADGKVDLLVSGDRTYILFGTGPRAFGNRMDLPSAALAADVNRDGATDLVLTTTRVDPSGAPAFVTFIYVSTAKKPAPLTPENSCATNPICAAPPRI